MLDVHGVRIRLAGSPGDAWLQATYPLWFRPDDGAAVDLHLECDVPADAESLVAFQHRLDEAVLAHVRGLVPVHAGVVEAAGRLVILPAPSGAGKSSLVAHLVRQGARYLSDEYAFIDSSGRVHAYPRPPMLRDLGGRTYLDLTVSGSITACPDARRPDVVLLLEHRPEEPSARLERIDAAAGTMGLLRNTPHTWRDRPGLVTALARAVSSALVYRGVRGDAASAWAAIEARIAADTAAAFSGVARAESQTQSYR